METNKNPTQTLVEMVNHAARHYPELMGQVVELYRKSLSDSIANSFQNTVAYGPFKGLKLNTESSWDGGTRAAMVLGLYEQELLLGLENLRNKSSTFIDLGAADGYYGIGVLVARLFEKSYCFEISDAGQSAIKKNAEFNGVSEKLVVRGAADKNFHRQIEDGDLLNSVLFVDIEGAEFDLFDAEVFRNFSTSIIFIELHHMFFSDAAEKISHLKRASDRTHLWQEFCSGARDPSAIVELNDLPDTARWLLCSEGRGKLMSWVRLDPK